MKRNKIETRYQLAARYDLSRATICRTFNEDWSGEATTAMLAFISQAFDIHPGKLIEHTRAA